MSTKTKNAKSTVTSSSVATVGLPAQSIATIETPEQIRAKIESLNADLARAQAAIVEAQKAAIAEMDRKISELPAHLGLKPIEGQNPLGMVLALVASMVKSGTTAQTKNKKALNGGIGKGGRLTDDQKGAIAKALHAGKKSDVIASEIGCSIPTVNVIKAKLGLTRKKSAVAAK